MRSHLCSRREGQQIYGRVHYLFIVSATELDAGFDEALIAVSVDLE